MRWADSVGSTLTRTTYFKPEAYPRSFTPSAPWTLKQCKSDDKADPDRPTLKTFHSAPELAKSYKEALLTPASTYLYKPRPKPRRSPRAAFPPLEAGEPFSRHQLFKGRCFRCLGRSHRASCCREPVRCVRCFKFGHLARSCMDCQRLPMQ